MAIFVTGATGFIGSKLCEQLAGDSEDVVAFCRSKPYSFQNFPSVRIVRGDLKSQVDLVAGMQGCSGCIHLAGLASQWSRRRSDFYDVNVVGTKNVLHAATANGISKLVFVSTAGVFGPSPPGKIINEDSPIPDKLGTHYERSKRQAELLVLDEVDRNRLDACIVCPTRVFGPGVLTEANGVTRIMQGYETGAWRLMPGDGASIGNYVFIEDVVLGLVKALRRGESGRRYILGGENLSFGQLFDLIAKFSVVRTRLKKVPYAAAMFYAQLQLAGAWLFGRKPVITPPFVRKYYRDYRIDCQRTQRELNYSPTPIDQAVQQTMRWLQFQPTQTRSW